MAIALVSMFVAVTIPPQQSSWVFILLLVGGGVVYYMYVTLSGNEHEQRSGEEGAEWNSHVAPSTGAVLLLLVLGITIVVAMLPGSDLGFRVLKMFWRIGLCVFGGGTVVVPMLLK